MEMIDNEDEEDEKEQAVDGNNTCKLGKGHWGTGKVRGLEVVDIPLFLFLSPASKLFPCVVPTTLECLLGSSELTTGARSQIRNNTTKSRKALIQCPEKVHINLI
jgi:hypothetical protein